MYKPKCPWLFAVFVVCASAYRVVVDAGSPTGIYTDNGVQTVKQDLMSSEERNEVEQEILTMFGVPKKSHKSPNNLDGSASQFLFDVYKSIQHDGEHKRKTRSVSEVGLYDDHTVQDSDVIVTLYLSNHSPISNIRHEHGKRILFDLNDVPSIETHLITSAEVYIYQFGSSNQNVKMYSVTLYQVLITKSRDKDLEFVGTQNISSDFNGWLRFNTTNAVMLWTHSYPNRGLHISVHALDNESREIKPEEIGIITCADNRQLFSETKKPFMAVYLKSKNGGNIASNPFFQKHRRRRRKTFENSSSSKPNPFQSIPTKRESCQIQTLYVSFKDLDWQDWIIAPDGYNAFFCTGECDFPLNSHMNATNHAIVQTLVHIMNPLKIPKPCCAPTKMSQQAVLFFLEDNNVILKKYKNMIIKSCGCH